MIDALLTEIDNFSIPNLCWRGKHEVIGGTSVEAAAQHIYSKIAMGECVTFFNINARCEEHSQPCRKCSSAQVLSNQKTSMCKIAKSISETIYLETIMPDQLYEIQYEVLMRHDKILNKMYPLDQAQARYSSACFQVHKMILGKIAKRYLGAVIKINMIFNKEFVDGKIQLLPKKQFDALPLEKPTAFMRLNIAFNEDSPSTP